MAVTANYETVMIISMKKGEEGIQAIVEKFKALIEKHATLKNGARESLLTLSTKRAKAIMFFSILKVKLSSLQSSTVSTRSQKA